MKEFMSALISYMQMIIKLTFLNLTQHTGSQGFIIYLGGNGVLAGLLLDLIF